MNLLLLVALGVLVWLLWRERRRYRELASEVDDLVAEARKDALKRSKDTRRGQEAEQFAPWIPGFVFNPKDARFVGSPVDFVVFDGLDAGAVERVVVVEVKCGDGADLSPRQRQIRRCMEEGRVDFEVVHVDFDEVGLDGMPADLPRRKPTT